MSIVTQGRRPGAARNERARLAILRAASELIASQGYDHLTIEGIAARAKVGKPTIYRWWPSKSALIADCLVDDILIPDAFVPKSSDDVVADITEWFGAVVHFVNEAQNEILLRSIIAAAVDNREVALGLTHRLGATPESLDGRLRSAVASGQLIAEAPIAHISELLIGAIIYRIIADTGLGDADAAIYVHTVLAGNVAAS
jgi:AcrR family transcriptional regulator